jgi:serine/threonine protein kinase/tetratricopeptide (TPR) repeat protein
MLQCSQCGRQFDTDVTVCPEDGTPLSADSTVADATPEDPLVGRLLDDKYRLDARLGVGGMGTVYRATHLLIERPVAVKVLNPRLVADETAKERFRREARAAGRLQHTNAVAVTDFGETHDGVVYIVMELLEGKPLRDILALDAPLDAARAVSLMLQVAAAVEAAHEAGIIHRDLKPGNIFLVQRPSSPYLIKVLDFGIAKTAPESGDASLHDTLTGTGVMIGTPRYMSPEQCDGAQLTPASDVYSLGVILYEMLTGQTPFTGASPLSLALKHSSESPRPPRELVSTIPPALEQLVLHALEKSPADRPADAGEFRRELFSIAERLGLEHSAGFSAPTIENLRDAGTETPSGRLIIDIERLRRNRAATQSGDEAMPTGQAGEPTSDEEIAQETSGKPASSPGTPAAASGAHAASHAATHDAAASTPSAVEPSAGVERSGSPAAILEGDTARAQLAAAFAARTHSAPSSEASPSSSSRAANSSSHAASSSVGADAGRRARVSPRGEEAAWKSLTRPPVLAVIVGAALLVGFGLYLLLRSPARGNGAASSNAQSDAQDDAMGRALSSDGSSPRGAALQQPKTAAEFYENGTYFLSIRSYDAAVRDLRRAVELQPDFPSAHNRLGRALMLKGQFGPAADEFRTAVEQSGGNNPVAQYNLGFALQQQGERDKALAAYRDAINSKGGNYPDAFYQIGSILYEQGHFAESADAFRKTIEQNQGRDPEAFYRLGVALAQQKDYDGAESAFKQAVDQRGGDFAYAHYNLGLLYQQTNRPDEAIKEFETFLQQSPRDENRYKVENSLRDLRRRAARKGGNRQSENANGNGQ